MVNAQHTHTQGMRGGLGVGGRWRCKIVTTAHSPPSTPSGAGNSVDRMLGTPVCDWEQVEDSGGEDGDKKFGVRLNRRGPVVPKGTLRAPVSPFQTTVWRYGDSGHEEIRE